MIKEIVLGLALASTSYAQTAQRGPDLEKQPEVFPVCQNLEMITAGNLYLYNAGSSLTPKELEMVAGRVQQNFNSAGIDFSTVQVLSPGKFPALEGLDALMYLFDRGTAERAGVTNEEYLNSPASVGHFGISLGESLTPRFDYLFSSQLHEQVKKIMGHPYGMIESAAHTGYVVIDKTLEPKCFKTRRSTVEVVIRRITHEMGHALGSGHIVNVNEGRMRVDTAPDFFMGYGECNVSHQTRTQPAFDTDTILKMHNFIENITSGRFSREDIVALRWMHTSAPTIR